MAFEVAPANVDELAQGDPRELALENARRKALAVPGELVLGADTDVGLDGEVLGKPRDAAHARELLARLAGRRHEVVGGIAIAEHGAITAQDVVVTAVDFRALDDADARLVRRDGRVGGPRRRLRDPGPRRRPRRGDRGRLPQRRRAAARAAAGPAARPAAGRYAARLSSAGSMPGGPSSVMPCSAARRPRRSASGASRGGSSRRCAGTP